MTRRYETKAFQTIDILNNLIRGGISRISVLLRHSKRHYTKDSAMEPFMRLTPEGRSISFKFGQALAGDIPPQFFSSFIGRCIETAYLIDKGFTATHKITLPHTRNETLLSPYYINDLDHVIEKMQQIDDHAFLRTWFNGEYPESLIENPVRTADRISRFMTDQLDTANGPALTLCISHDWNLFPVKEFKLHQPFETAGDIGYLEGIFFYQKGSSNYILGIDSDPVVI